MIVLIGVAVSFWNRGCQDVRGRETKRNGTSACETGLGKVVGENVCCYIRDVWYLIRSRKLYVIQVYQVCENVLTCACICSKG